jgi:hypothetical protein
MSTIQNCPVTVEDVNISEKIFGPEMSSLKGKPARQKPKPVRSHLIKIPKELITKHHDVELCMDAMDVNECGMLTAIDQTVKFQSLVAMNAKQHNEYYRALSQILRHYNQAGFMIRMIHCNGELCGVMEKVKDDLDVDMNFTNAQDHLRRVPALGETYGNRAWYCISRKINILSTKKQFIPQTTKLFLACPYFFFIIPVQKKSHLHHFQ